jgi:hypothetical protein
MKATPKPLPKHKPGDSALVLWRTIRTGDQFEEVPVQRIRRDVFYSNTRLREFLETQARRTWGGRTGRDWRIVAAPSGTLVPIYARHVSTGESLHIE